MKGLEIPEQGEDYTADPVELFFDLAFVFAYSQLVGLLITEPDWTGVGKAALIFMLLWLPWSQMTWAANAVPGNARNTRVIFLVATAASVPMAASVTTAFDDGGPLLAIPLAFITLMGLTMVVLAARGRDVAMRTAVRYSIPVAIGMGIIVVGSFLDDQLRVAAWLVGLAFFTFSAFGAGGGEWTMRAGHFAERHGLIIIVALGEVIVATGKPLVDSLEEGAGIPAESAIALTAAGGFACLLWWAYFDRPQRAFEARAEGIELSSERAQYARDVYTFAHAPIVAGIVAAAAALEEIVLHPSDPLPLSFRMMALGGGALYALGIAIGTLRSYRVLPRERMMAFGLVAVLLIAGGDIDGVWLIVAMNLILIAALVIEHLRIEVRPAHEAQLNN
ncbi:MAG: low temperature requirement protein A [Actinomycetota bacterium]